MGSIYVICSRQCPNGDGIYTLLYALYKYSTSITNQPTNQLPTCVVLQCGGNDSERRSAEAVIQQYDALIDDVQYYCPTAHIVISKVPLRGNNTDISSKINEINKYLENRATRGDGVIFIDACPQSLSMFKKDLVHFNSRGMRFYAQSMCNNLTNFTRSRQQRVI